MWVFGYGSLVWKVDFPFEKRVPGYVRGYVRRFWQGSIDHRGVPESPGRVVTLIPYSEWLLTHASVDPHHNHLNDECWGIAYKIPESEEGRVRAHLDHREKNGYQIFKADVYHPDGPKNEKGQDIPIVKDAMVYVATSENESFLGPVDIKAMAKQIAESRGPSGWNADYLLGLCHSMRLLAPHAPDIHLVELERAVLEALDELKVKDGSRTILPQGTIRQEDLEDLKALLDVDVKALVIGEEAARKATALAHAAKDGIGRAALHVATGSVTVEASADARVVISDKTPNEIVETTVTILDGEGSKRELAHSRIVVEDGQSMRE